MTVYNIGWNFFVMQNKKTRYLKTNLKNFKLYKITYLLAVGLIRELLIASGQILHPEQSHQTGLS
jgi:hypothetical protein